MGTVYRLPPAAMMGVMQFVHDASPTAEAPPDHRLSMRLLGASTASLIGFGLCYLLLRRSAPGRRFDAAAFAGSLAVNPSDLGSNDLKLIIGPTLILALAALVLIGAIRRRFLLGVAAALAAAVAVGVTEFFKHVVFAEPVRGHSNTFPSGHTATAVGCAMALMLVMPSNWRAPMTVVAGALGWIVGVQTEIVSWHSPSEVIGGALLAFAAVTGVAGLLAWFRPVEHQALRYESVSLAVLGVVGILAAGTTGVALAHGFGRLPIAVLPGVPLSRVDLNDFVAGASLSVVVVTALMAALLLLLRGTQFGGPAGPGRLHLEQLGHIRDTDPAPTGGAPNGGG
jgi:membrane-associated phospholipid phosphatase